MVNSPIKIYFLLLAILAVLITAVLLFPSGKREGVKEIPVTVPTPTTVTIPVTGRPVEELPTPVVQPTGTGGNEDISTAMRDVSVQKQNLRRRVPLKETTFTIEFNYADDNFIITLNEPRTMNHELFNSWLKQNYPLIPASEFVFK